MIFNYLFLDISFIFNKVQFILITRYAVGDYILLIVIDIINIINIINDNNNIKFIKFYKDLVE